MSLYLQATLEIEGTGMARFMEVMGEAIPILEGVGWQLEAAYRHCTGRLNTVIDHWVLEDLNHFDRGMQALGAHPRFPAIHQVLGETVRNETLVFLQKFDYVRR